MSITWKNQIVPFLGTRLAAPKEWFSLLSWSGLSLKSKLGVGFGSVLLLTIALGIIGIIGQRVTLSHLDKMAGDHARIADLAAKAVIELNGARKNEIEYLLHVEYELAEGWARHVIHLQRGLIRLRQDIQEMKQVLATPEVNEECKQCDSIEEFIGLYEKGFLDVVGLTAKAGRVDSGLEGDFRQKIRELEETSELQAAPQIMIALLMVRRYEKDYIARGRDIDIRNHAQAVTRLERELGRRGLPLTKARMLLLAVAKYREYFNRYVAVKSEIAVISAKYVLAAEAAAHLLEAMRVEESTEIADMRSGAQIVKSRAKLTHFRVQI